MVYGEGKDNLDIFVDMFRSMRLLETVAEVAAEEYLWRRPLTLQMETCGNAGAYWKVPIAKVTLCYEMADDFAELYRDYVIPSELKVN